MIESLRYVKSIVIYRERTLSFIPLCDWLTIDQSRSLVILNLHESDNSGRVVVMLVIARRVFARTRHLSHLPVNVSLG